MKKIELLGLSAVTAVLIMTGCSSDDNNGGAVAPAEITAAVDLNSSTLKTAIYMLRSISNNKLPAPQLATATTTTGGGHENNSYTYDCDVSGSYTETYTYSWDGVQDADHGDELGMSWSWTETETTTYNNCLDEYAYTNNYSGDLMTHRLRTGSYSLEKTNSYDLDTNTSKQTNVWSDNYSYAYENNESEATMIYIYNQNRTRTSVWAGESYRDTYYLADGASYNYQDVRNGLDSRVDTNSTGSIIYGYKTEKGNYNEVQEGVKSVSDKYTVNGFSSSYDMNTSGEWVLSGGKSFSNFVITSTANGTDEDNMTVSGKMGSACIGGSVTFATAPVLQQDQVNYFNTYSTNNNYTLPHAGAMTVSGTGSATVTFDSNESNYTSAIISGIDDVNETVGSWYDLAVQTCVN